MTTSVHTAHKCRYHGVLFFLSRKRNHVSNVVPNNQGRLPFQSIDQRIMQIQLKWSEFSKKNETSFEGLLSNSVDKEMNTPMTYSVAIHTCAC